MQDALDKLAPEGHHYRHLDEGLDDMPAHVKVTCYQHINVMLRVKTRCLCDM
jgi:thiamine phosphate synthase YjbQ (UPF0047 family)